MAQPQTGHATRQQSAIQGAQAAAEPAQVTQPARSRKRKRPVADSPSEKNDEDRKKRGKLFDGVDVNGNGYLSLAEVDKGMRDVLGCSQLFDCKPAMMRAFQAAKASVKTKSKLGADYVERCEFRLLLVYLKKYFELFQLFRTIDASSDRRISKEEFGQSIDLLEKWGLDTKGRSADAMFKEIDTDNGGMLLFDEISKWALREKLNREGEDDDGMD